MKTPRMTDRQQWVLDCLMLYEENHPHPPEYNPFLLELKGVPVRHFVPDEYADDCLSDRPLPCKQACESMRRTLNAMVQKKIDAKVSQHGYASMETYNAYQQWLALPDIAKRVAEVKEYRVGLAKANRIKPL